MPAGTKGLASLGSLARLLQAFVSRFGENSASGEEASSGIALFSSNHERSSRDSHTRQLHGISSDCEAIRVCRLVWERGPPPSRRRSRGLSTVRVRVTSAHRSMTVTAAERTAKAFRGASFFSHSRQLSRPSRVEEALYGCLSVGRATVATWSRHCEAR